MSEVAKYVFNENEKLVTKFTKVLKDREEKYGKPYCPFAGTLSFNDDNVCPCTKYKETGECRCELYVE